MRALIFGCIACLLLVGGVFSGNAQSTRDSSGIKSRLSVDLISFYHVFFDTREQIRLGVSYERILPQGFSAGCHVDAGQYDNYTFIKYYDFFSESGPMWAIEQDVSVSGLHLMPFSDFRFFRSVKNPNRALKAGIALDYHYYKKKEALLNTLTFERTRQRYTQTGLSAGLSLSGSWGWGRHFLVECKTVLFGSLYRSLNEHGAAVIRSLQAQWNNNRRNLCWVNHLSIGYAF
jgi:hypothetical protein